MDLVGMSVLFLAWRPLFSARNPFCRIARPAVPTALPLRTFWRRDASTVENDAQNHESPDDTKNNGFLAARKMFLGPKLAREWLTQTLMKVFPQVRHQRIVRKRTTIADTSASDLLCLDRLGITRRWFSRQGLKKVRRLYIAEAEELAIVCQAHAILRRIFHVVFLHVQVDVVFVLERLTGIVAHPLRNLAPVFG